MVSLTTAYVLMNDYIYGDSIYYQPISKKSVGGDRMNSDEMKICAWSRIPSRGVTLMSRI